ncbi:MAG: thioredoxin family protein [Bacteroidota bacterium]
MSLTPSTMNPLGFAAPNFNLPDTVSGSQLSLQDLQAEKATVIMFICNHCPFVVHVRDGLVQLARDYQDRGIGFVAISSNDVANYPQDGPEHMKALAASAQFPFPYLYDETQEVARAYDAACTPDLYVFDAGLHCVYRGQLDGARPGNGVPVTGEDLRAALDAILAGEPVSADQKPSIGCNIKWK